MRKLVAIMIVLAACCTSSVLAADLKLLTAGAFKQVALEVVPEFEKQTGHKVIVENDTVGALTDRIEKGDGFDVAVLSPAALGVLARDGKIQSGSETKLASVGVGVMVREGAPKPDISTVDAFKTALLNATSVAYIDPKSGGSSGIYVDKLLEKLGIADQVRVKAKLKQGGHVADLLLDGSAELGIHQISEIVPVKGVVLVGPLPKEIQKITTYAGGIGVNSTNKDAAVALLNALRGPEATQVLRSKGMEPAPIVFRAGQPD